MEPIYSPRSVADLETIWWTIAQDNLQTANNFVEQLKRTAQSLQDMPRMGRRRPDLAKGVRSFPHGNYLILYEIVYERVRLLHFVHGSRNLKRLLRQDKNR